jgi:hypothetical protein
VAFFVLGALNIKKNFLAVYLYRASNVFYGRRSKMCKGGQNMQQRHQVCGRKKIEYDHYCFKDTSGLNAFEITQAIKL